MRICKNRQPYRMFAAVCVLSAGVSAFDLAAQSTTPSPKAATGSISSTPEFPAINSPQPPLPPSITPPAVNAPVFNSAAANPYSLSESKTAQNQTKTAALQKLSATDIGTLSSLFSSQNPFSIQTLGETEKAAYTALSGGSNAATSFVQTGIQNETAVLLQAILEKLDNLQKTVEKKETVPSAAERKKNDILNGSISENGRILRFIAGNGNILPTCTAVFISKPEADGSFLLTGDRTYRTSGGVYSETFYMLFKAAENGLFNAAFSLSQPTENPQSPLYALSQNTFLQAVRTGNFVALHTSMKNIHIDLLLEIDFEVQEKKR